MSTAMVTTLYDYSDILCKKPNVINTNKTDFPLDRRPISPSTIFNFQGFRTNSANHLTSFNISPPSPKSVGMHQKPGLPVCSNSIPNACTSNNIFNLSNGGRELRKLDRTISDPVERSNAQAKSNQTNSSRYKTELCRPFEENGTCKYGDKCQFAHGNHELRTLSRHPKYKTELCRTFHTTGLCPYGSRCHFIHYSEETRKNLLSNLQVGMNTFTLNECPSTSPSDQGVASRPKALSIGSFSLDSAGDSSPPSSMSGSPTSLNSFFNDDAFGNFSPNFQSNPLSDGNTAFSFSQDFTSLMSTLQQQAHLSPFGVSQPVTTPAVFSRSGLTSPNSEIMDSSFREQLYSVVPPAPPSPVDSITSELDGLSLASSPGMATCSSPLDINRTPFRLPIFSSLANFE